MYIADILKTNFIHEFSPGSPDFIDFLRTVPPETPIFTA